MKSCLIAVVGISGSGKSYLRKTLKDRWPDMKVVCPDDIRLLLTGDISDQSKNKEVFDMAYDMAHQYIKDGKLVYFDATNLGKSLNKLCNEFGKLCIPVFLSESRDLELCYGRIKKDLELGKNRSRVPRDVIERQYTRFMDMDPKKYDQSFEITTDDSIQDLIDFIEEDTENE